MAWNHDDVGPNRSRDELLGDVVRRGEGLRRRKRLIAGAGCSLAMVVAVAGVASVAGQGGEPATDLAAGSRTTTTFAFGTATGGTVFAVEAPTTTAAVEAAPATTVPRPVATTVPADDEAVVPTPPAVVAEDPTPGPGQPRCSAAQMETSFALAPSYRQGQPIQGQAVLRNKSGAPCYYYSYSQGHTFRDASGTGVGISGAIIADAFADTAFAPGQTLTETASWDQQLCPTGGGPCGQAPPGTYTATVTWSFDGPPIESSVTFQIVP